MVDLRSVILETKRERIVVEGTTIGGIICPLIKINDWDVYIYGGGRDVSAIILYLWNLEICVKGILDCDSTKEGKMVLNKVPIINPSKITEKFYPEKTFVIINTIYFVGIEQYEIISLLSDLGITKFYELSAFEKSEIKAKADSLEDAERVDYYREHIEELEDTFRTLYDTKSKEIMIEYIRTYVEFGTFSLKQCSGNLKYFWGQNDDGTKEELYKHLGNEVWINCGSNNGDNIFWYFANSLEAESIYAYEANKGIYARFVKNLRYLPEPYRKRVHPINELINNETDWNILNGNQVTLINADIEGAELDLLKSLQNIITLFRPTLAICVYHKASDLVEIPLYIRNIVKDYCYVLRKYESNVENIRRTAELVLYAIPKERISEQL